MLNLHDFRRASNRTISWISVLGYEKMKKVGRHLHGEFEGSSADLEFRLHRAQLSLHCFFGPSSTGEVHCADARALIQGGPLLAISRVITPISRVIPQVWTMPPTYHLLGEPASQPLNH